MGREGFDQGDHAGLGDADRPQGLQHRLAGFLQARASKTGGSSTGWAAGQAPQQHRHRLGGLKLAERAGSRLPQAVVPIVEGVQQLGNRAGIAQLAQGAGGIAGDGVLLDTGAGIPGAPLAQGGQQQGQGLRVAAAMAAQPPGGVVLLRVILALSKALQRFGLRDRFACCADPGIWIDGSSHGLHGAGERVRCCHCVQSSHPDAAPCCLGAGLERIPAPSLDTSGVPTSPRKW